MKQEHPNKRPKFNNHLHKLLEGRIEGDVVVGVGCLERLMSWMMHHGRRQSVEGYKVGDHSYKVGAVARKYGK